MSNTYVNQAMQFAMDKHTGQLRRYTNEPYWGHLAEVAGIVAMTRNNTPELLQIAWLHDTVEDTDATFEEISDQFGVYVSLGVKCLTDCEEGNRKTRKQKACQRLSAIPGELQTIKYADGLSNLRSIIVHDKKFAKVYLQEWTDLLQVMNKGDPWLYTMIKREVKQAQALLEIEKELYE